MQRNSVNNDKASGVNIKVIVRCRPLNEKERNDPNNEEVVRIRNNEVIVTLNRNNEVYEKKYNFDYVCDPYVNQKSIFTNYVFQIVDEVLEGFNCTLFCYGQTGTGKTYTMEGKLQDAIKGSESGITSLSQSYPGNHKKSVGSETISSDIGNCYDMYENEDTGLILRAIKRIFDYLNKKKEEAYEKYKDHDNIMDPMDPEAKQNELNNIEESSLDTSKSESNYLDPDKSTYDFSVKVSYLEIYNEELCDLLSTSSEGNKLRIYEDASSKNKGLNVDKLEEKTVNSFEEIYYIICSAIRRRRTAETSYNTKSSRSHSIFTISLTMKFINNEGENVTKMGKLNLVDLAGSENAVRNSLGNTKIRQQESCNINQSLLTLGRVINALVENNSYIPYRDSKLTRLLQDSLGGKTKTFIVATISPSSLCVDETIGTLDYVFRAKNIKNKPEINMKTTKKIRIRDLNNEIEKLKNALTLSREKNGVYLDNKEYTNMQNSLRQNKELILEKDKILYEQTRQIETLVAKMVYSDDARNQVCIILKHVLSKYKNMKKVYEMMINQIVIEKCMNQFLLNECNQYNNKFEEYMNLYEQTQKKLACLYNDHFLHIKKNVHHHNVTLYEICKMIMKLLNETKDQIHQKNENLMQSELELQQKNKDLFFRRKEFINSMLDQLDIAQKYNEHFIFDIDKIKKSILKCKMHPFANNELLLSTKLLRKERIQVEDFLCKDYPPNGTKLTEHTKEVTKEKQFNQIHQDMLHILKDFTWNDEGKEILNKIDCFLNKEKESTETLIQYIKNLCHLFHMVLRTYVTEMKKEIQEKNTMLNEKQTTAVALFDSIHKKVNTIERDLNVKSNNKINQFKKELTEEMQVFQNKIMGDIQEVITKNIHNINERVSEKLESLQNEITNETKKEYKQIFASSLLPIQQFMNEYNTNTVQQYKYLHNTNEQFFQKSENLHVLLDKVLVDLNQKAVTEETNIQNNIKLMVNVFNQELEKNNVLIEGLADEFSSQTKSNINDKEELFQNISNKVLQERNELTEEEENLNKYTSVSKNNTTTHNQKLLQTMETFQTYINEIVTNLKINYFQNVDESKFQMIGNQVNVKKVDDILEEMIKVRNQISREISIQSSKESTEPKSQNEDGESTANEETEEENQQVYKQPIKDIQYHEIKNGIEKEMEELCEQKNINYKSLFEKIDEKINGVMNINEESKIQESLNEHILDINENNMQMENMPNIQKSNALKILKNKIPASPNKKSPQNINVNNKINGTINNNLSDLNNIRNNKEDKIPRGNTYSSNGNNMEPSGNVNLNLNNNENKSPNNKLKTFELSNSKKNSPIYKRIKDDNFHGRKNKIPRKSKN